MIQTPDRVGLPLHVVNGPEILYSFGVPTDGDAPPVTALNSSRYLATDESGHIFSAPPYDYSIEVFSETGERIAGFKGPHLDVRGPLPGRWSDDNRPPNMIVDIRADDEGRLWVLMLKRQKGWRGHMLEQIAPDGRVALLPFEDTMKDVYDTHVGVIDLNGASIIASGHQEEVFWAFLPDGSALEPRPRQLTGPIASA